jgi:hypothetical protein
VPRRSREESAAQSPDPVPHKKRKVDEHVQKAKNDGSALHKTDASGRSDIKIAKQNPKPHTYSDS